MESLERRFRLSVPSSPENLAMIREFVVRVGEKAGLPSKEVDKLELAVDEACANVIEHAYGDDRAREISVRAVLDADRVTISVEDTGLGFDPSAVPEEDLADLVSRGRSGGLGMRLIRSLMDEVRYEIEPGRKNELRMSKKLVRP